MVLLSNMGGLHFRLAQNRKGLTYQPRPKPLESPAKAFKLPQASESDSDFFNRFLQANQAPASPFHKGAPFPAECQSNPRPPTKHLDIDRRSSAGRRELFAVASVRGSPDELADTLGESQGRSALKVEEGGEAEPSVEATLRRYSADNSFQSGFLELAIRSLEKIESATSARFFLMPARVGLPRTARFEEAFCRDLFAKVKLVVGFRLFLELLARRSGSAPAAVFQQQASQFERFQKRLADTIRVFEAKENVARMERALARVMSREAGWAGWKLRRCEGNILARPEPAARAKSKFSGLEAEAVAVKMKALAENGETRKFIFKRASEKREAEKMKNWISLKENHDLLRSLETEDLWIDRAEVEMGFALMAGEVLRGASLGALKRELEESGGKGRGRAEADPFVQWRFSERLVKRSFESLVADHEKDFCGFLEKNADCFADKALNQKLLQMRYSKESVLLRQRSQALRESLREIRSHSKGGREGGSEWAGIRAKAGEAG